MYDYGTLVSSMEKELFHEYCCFKFFLSITFLIMREKNDGKKGRELEKAGERRQDTNKGLDI